MERRAGKEGAGSGGGGRRRGGREVAERSISRDVHGVHLSLRPDVTYAVGGTLKASDLRNVSCLKESPTF